MGKIDWKNGTAVKTPGQALADNVAFLMVCALFVWVLEKLVSWVFAPFTWTTKSAAEMVKEDCARKIEARRLRLNAFDRDEKDPMHQFQERFVKNPGKWDGDPDNAAYLNWYSEWKAGRVLDTQLRWAPNLMKSFDSDDVDDEIGMFLKDIVSGNFLAYLAIQLGLHKAAAPAWRRRLFLATIRRFYPEFQPTEAGLVEDIVAYGSEALAIESERELVQTFKENGIPEAAWGYLRTVPAKQLKAKMEYLRNCASQECDPDVAVALCDAGVPYDATSDGIASRMIGDLGLPGKAVGLYLRKKLSIEDVKVLAERLREFRESFGGAAYEHRDGTPDGVTFQDEMFDQYLKELDESKRARKVDRLCKSSAKR